MTWLITLSENNCSVVAFTKRNRSSHPRCSVRKGVLRNFVKFTRKHLCHSIFFNKVPGLRPATLLKNRLWHRCFPVNFAKFLRTPFLQNTSGRLLLEKSLPLQKLGKQSMELQIPYILKYFPGSVLEPPTDSFVLTTLVHKFHSDEKVILIDMPRIT